MKTNILGGLSVLVLFVLLGIYASVLLDSTDRIKEIECKLDSISNQLDKIDTATDTVYADIDDISQENWRAYTLEHE